MRKDLAALNLRINRLRSRSNDKKDPRRYSPNRNAGDCLKAELKYARQDQRASSIVCRILEEHLGAAMVQHITMTNVSRRVLRITVPSPSARYEIDLAVRTMSAELRRLCNVNRICTIA